MGEAATVTDPIDPSLSERANRNLQRLLVEMENGKRETPMVMALLDQKVATIQRAVSLQIALDAASVLAINQADQRMLAAFADLLHEALGGGPRPGAYGPVPERMADADARTLLKQLHLPARKEQYHRGKV